MEPKVSQLNPLNSGFSKSMERVLIAAFTTRNTIPFGLLVIMGICAWRLDPRDLSLLISDLIHATWFIALGWMLFIVATIVALNMYRRLEATYEREIKRLMDIHRGANNGDPVNKPDKISPKEK